MPFTIQNDRSQLPVTANEWRVSASKTSATSSNPAATAFPANVPGQVSGAAAHGAPSLRGRATPTAAARPRNPVGNAVFQNTHALNSVLTSIERLRPGANAELPPLGKAMLQQIDRIAEACGLITGGPAVGESLVDQHNALSQLVQKGADAGLEGGMEAIRNQGGSSSGAKVGKELTQIQAWSDQVTALAEDRLKYISQSLSASALSVSKHYETKANMSTAAISVLDEVIATEKAKGNTKSATVLEKGKASFEARELRMRQVAKERSGEIGEPKKFGGTRKFGALGTLLHPMKAHAEKAARAKCAEQIAAGKGDADVEALDTNEMDIVEDALAKILKDAKVSGHDAKREVQHAFLNVLDANPAWGQTISTEMHLPIVTAAASRPGAGRDPFGIPDEPKQAQGPQPLPLRTLIVKSEISPAAVHFGSYQGQGVNAHRSTEHIHATNLAHTQLKDSAGNTLFSGVRHGVLSAYGLQKDGVKEKEMPDHELARRMKDLLPDKAWKLDFRGQRDLKATMKAVRSNPRLVEQMRATANKNRAMEVVAMTIASDPALRDAALKSEKPTVNILSLSLLTPDAFRSLRGGLHDNEGLMVLDQVDAWGSVAGMQTIDIPVDGKTVAVQVDVKPVPMNYGVNQGAVKGVAGLHTEEVSGWHVSDTLNDEALHSLFGKNLTHLATSRTGVLGERIGELEARHREELENAILALQTHNIAVMRSGGSNPDAANARRMALEAKVKALESVPNDARTPLGGALALARQIGEIHREGAHRNAGTEPYKMPTRLAVLADLLGVKVAFNCKSGKDRTGELDAEIKHMKLSMAITGEVPHYKRERAPEEIRRFHEVVTNGGNQRMQELNTGFAGYKLQGVSALYQQFGGDGDDALTRNFHGTSHLTAT